MSLRQLSQTPPAHLENIQCSQWLSVVYIKFSENTWNSTICTVVIEKWTTKFDILEIINWSRLQDLWCIASDEFGVDLLNGYTCNQLVSIHQVGTTLKSLTGVLGKGIHCRWMWGNEANSGDILEYRMPFESLEKLGSNIALANGSIDDKLSDPTNFSYWKDQQFKFVNQKKNIPPL